MTMQDDFTAEVGEDASEATASVTITRPPEALHALWRDSATLPRIMDHFASIQPLGGDQADWTVEAPLGRTYRWRTVILHDDPAAIRWSTLDGADIPNEGMLTFRPAPADRGAEVSLHVRFDPPGGMLGKAGAKLFHIVPREIVLKALYKFRALAIAGEIPTTHPQPAARHGGADE